MQRKLHIAFLLIFLFSFYISKASDCGFTIAISTTDANCYGNADGSISVDPFGSNSNYTYLWNDPNNQTSYTASNLYAGTYQVTITDLNNCDTTLSITIGEPKPLQIATSSNNVSCYSLCDAKAQAQVIGGTVPYSFLWDDPSLQTDSIATNLCADTFSVIVKDSKGCLAKKSVIITEPSLLKISSADASLLCYGNCDASVSSTANGGTLPYSYSWNDPLAQASSSATNLCAGNYIVTITDSNGCMATDTSEVTQPSELTGTLTPTNPLCYGDCNGSISVLAGGGTSPYTYVWNTNATTTSISKLCEGSYSVIISDKNGCKDTSSVSLIAPQPLTASISSSNTDCNNASSNFAIANVSGGTNPYSYQWSTSPIQTNDTAINLTAGTYIVVIKDANACQTTATKTISNSTPVFIPTPTVVQPTCQAANGQITINAYGGQGPLSYSWSNNSLANINSMSGLSPGTYTITVSDTNGCSASTSITLSNSYNAVFLDTLSITHVPCYGGNNGSSAVSASGGSTPYSYTWNTNPIQTTSSVSNLKAGSYMIYVTDANGCSDTVNITITQPLDLSMDSVVISPSCKGNCDGKAFVNVSGGISPYTFLWNTSTVQITDTASNLCSGTYMVTVTDANACPSYLNVTVTEPLSLAINFTSTTVSCNGKSDATATASVSGGTSPYSYSWNTSPVQTSSTATNLAAGTYTLMVTDANDCSYSSSVTITEPNSLTTNISNTNPNCFGNCSGTATASVSGGTTPYSYSWNTSPIQTTSSALNLCSGSYDVIITDANGCTSTVNAIITEPSQINLSTSVKDASCGLYDGQASVSVSGGSSPYLYSWTGNTNQSTSTATNLSAGIYYITVYDSNGCTASDTLTVNNSNPISLSVSSTAESCQFNDGTASVIAIGGSGSYFYSWNSSPVQTSQTATALTAGTYTVVVTDQNSSGCKDSISVVVANPPTISVSFSSSSPSCKGDNNGSITATPTGGSSPYSYSWNTSPIQTTAIATNIIAGNYTVTVTDVNGCTITSSGNISEPSALSVTTNITNAGCSGSNTGTATAVASGGTTPYSYLWSNGATTSSATNLTAGTYLVTVTDANGCSAISSVTITEPTAMSISISSQNVNCYNACNGTAAVTVSGGTSPYTYLWSNSKTTSSISGLCAGSYTVTITDAKGCTSQASVTITEPQEIKLTIDTTVANCGMDNGKAVVNASGGTAPFSFVWSTTPTQYGDSATNIEPGIYYVTATDANGCKLSSAFVISTMTPFYLTINKINVSKCDTNDGEIEVLVDSGGTAPYTFEWDNGDSTNIIDNLPKGTYYVTITDSNGCDTMASIQIVQPPAITLSGTSIDASCGKSDGQATVIATGGTGPLSYAWSDSININSTAYNLPAGSYNVHVADTIGCGADTVFVINQPPLVNVSINGKDMSCGLTNGQAYATVTGGSGIFSVLWSNGYTDTSLTNLSQGIYSITVNDTNGCSDTASVTISGTQSLLLTATIKDATCGGSDGEIYVNVSGGNGIYTYTWQNNSSTNDTLQNLAEGNYILTVTDTSGCSSTDTFEVKNANPILISLTSIDIDCYGNTNGKIIANVSGGSGKYMYSWSNGMTNADSLTNLTQGTYYLTVSDSFVSSCFANDTAIITTPPLLSMTSSYQDISCFGANNGKINVSASGGKGQLNYVWTNSISTVDSAINLGTGTYSVSVIDSNNCSVSDTITILEPDSLQFSLSIKDIACGGANDGAIYSTISGGSFPYSYSWNTTPIQTTSFALNLGSGTYSIIVLDKNGCSVTDSASISQPDTVKISTKLIFGSCNGANDHSVYTIASGGSGFYSYSWNTNPVQTNDTISSLAGGTYIVTVTDSTGCSATDTIQVPTLLTITSTSYNDISCYGFNDGSIYVYTIGGSGEGTYTYNWNFSSLNNDTASNLSPGTYTVLVTDTNGCSDGDTITITEPTALVITLDSINASCGTSNGEVSVLASGGTLPYTYLWNNGSVSANVLSIPKGTYWVDVADANGCKISDTTSISEANPIILSMNYTDVLCNGANDGTASVSAAGGSGAYSYLWSTGGTTSSITNLAPGNYIVTVTDITSSLCNATDTVSISEPPLLTVTGTANNTCMGKNDGVASMVASGGTPSYTYQWNNGGTTASINNLPAANYIGVVTDANNCQASVTVSVQQPTTVFYLTPTVNPAYCGSSNGSIYLDVYATAPLIYEWSHDAVLNSDTALAIDSGTYYIHIYDTAGCDVYDTITVTNIDYFPLVTITDSSNLTCIGSNNGMAVAMASATNGSYSYEWNSSPLQLTDTAKGLAAGTYIVNVTDSLGCKAYDTVTIDNPDTLKIAFDITNISCNGFTNGTILANVSGGFSPYNYQWSNGDSSNYVDSLVPGTYQLSVFDSNQCIVIDSVVITQPAVLNDSAIITHVKCFGGNDGKIELFVSGGTQPYSYNWPVTANTNSTDSLLTAGVYYVDIIDSNGCFISDTFTISEPTAIILTLDSVSSTCSFANGEAYVIASGGTGSFKYLWSNGDTDSIAENLTSGNYSITVSDSNNCSITNNISITDIPTLTIDSIGITGNTCHSSNDATAEVVAVTGAGPFTYSWNPIGASDPLVTNLSAGTYSVTVYDTNQCSATVQIVITEPDSIVLSLIDSITICYGTQTNFSVTASGGNGVYTYIWNQGLDSTDNNTVSPVSNALYSVVVLDSNGCISDTASVAVIVNPPLTLSIEADSIVCAGEPSILFAKASGGNGGPYNYSWNGGVYSGDTIAVSPTSTSNFIVSVSDNCGTIPMLDSVEIIVNPLPITSMYITNSEGCSPLTVDFSYSTDIGDSIIWDFGDGVVAYDTTPQHTFVNPGIYNVSLTTITSKGCKSNSVNSAQVTVFSSPVANFEALPNEAPITNPSINFNDLSIDAYTWLWNFGDPNSGSMNESSEINPQHEFSDTGMYTIQLIVINTNGCLDTLYLPVEIKDTYIMSVPNAFTPDGDGINDVFIPIGYGTNPEGYNFSIFDRWGDLIFTTSSIQQGWEGTANGGSKRAPIDVYIWKLHVKDLNGFYHDYIGHVSLIE